MTDYARRMVTDFGMSDKLGTRTFGNKQEMVFLGREISEQRDYSERFALEIDKEIDKLIAEAYATAKKILTDNKTNSRSSPTSLSQKKRWKARRWKRIRTYRPSYHPEGWK